MSFAIVAAVAAPLVIGGIGAITNNRKANGMANDVLNSQTAVDNLISNRQEIYNAAEDIRALKGELSNAYANVGVATKAADMQAEQADVALANMLEGQKAAGFGGGGATALANAALKSKQGISANIEQQEAQNEKLRAQGEQQLQQQRISIEQAAIGAEQQAWQAQEEREVYDIDRLQAMADYQRNQQAAYEDQANAAMMAGISGATSVLGGAAASGAFKSESSGGGDGG